MPERQPDFKIYTGMLRTARDTTGKRRIYGVASSTTRDLHGDIMELSALQDMERAANNNMTIFLNHSYNVPEDVGGSITKAQVTRRDATHEGDPNYDLDIEAEVNEANPRAIQTFDALEAGTKLGISIGAMIPENGATRDKKSGALRISHVDLLEASFVGIPANPRSWIDYAVKSLRARELDVVDAELTGHERHNLPDSAFACPEKRLYPHHTASGGVDKPHLRAALSRVGDPDNDQCGKAHLEAHARALGMGDRKEESAADLLEALTSDFGPEHFALKAEGGDFSHDHEHAHTHTHPHDHGDGEMDHEHEHTHIHGHEHDHGNGEDHEHDDRMNHEAHDHGHSGFEGEHPHDGKTEREDDGDKADNDEDDDPKKKAVVTVQTPGATVWVDTDSTKDGAGSSSQAATGSKPGNGDGLLDETADGDNARLGDTVTRSTSNTLVSNNVNYLDNVSSGTGGNIQVWTVPSQSSIERTVELLAKTTSELIDARKQLVETELKMTNLERERDEAIVQRDRVLEATTKALDKISRIPLPRKTYYVEASSEFRERLKSIYPEGFLKLMEERDD